MSANGQQHDAGGEAPGGSHLKRILVAEDDAATRFALEKMLARWGFTVVAAVDGIKALSIIRGSDSPKLLLIDWAMPRLDGIDLCRWLRRTQKGPPAYVIMLTARTGPKYVVEGLEAGADDFIGKPFDEGELRARIQVGHRIVALQQSLETRVEELQDALAHVKTLQGIIPICMHCRRIRDDREAWRRMEQYIEERSDAEFSHGLCPDCMKTHYP